MASNISIERKGSRLVGFHGHVVLPAPFVICSIVNKKVSVESATGMLYDMPLSQVLQESGLDSNGLDSSNLHLGMIVNLDQSTNCKILKVYEDDTLEVSVNDTDQRAIVLIENILSWRCVNKQTLSPIKQERSSRLKGRRGHAIVPTPFTIDSIFNNHTLFASVNVMSITNPELAFNMPLEQLLEESGVPLKDLAVGMQVNIKHRKECQIARVNSDDTLDVRVKDSNQQTNVLIENFFFYD